MKALFKDDELFFFINNDILDWNIIRSRNVVDLFNIPHLDDVEVLYHYRDNRANMLLPVLYEYNGKLITKVDGKYLCLELFEIHTKDHTSTNLNLI